MTRSELIQSAAELCNALVTTAKMWSGGMKNKVVKYSKTAWKALSWKNVISLVQNIFNSVKHTAEIFKAAGTIMVVLISVRAYFDARIQTTIITPVNLPQVKDFPFDGFGAANILRDGLFLRASEIESRYEEVIGSTKKEPDNYTCLPPAPSQGSSSQPLNVNVDITRLLRDDSKSPLLSVGDVKVPTQYQVVVNGTSYESLVSFIRKLLHQEKELSSNIALENSRMVLLLRLESPPSFESDQVPVSYKGLQAASRGLALRYFQTSIPTLYAKYLIGESKFMDAYVLLRKLIRENDKSEVTKKLFLQAAYLESNSLFSNSRRGESFALLEEAMDLFPRTPLLIFQKISLQVRANNLPAALDLFVAHRKLMGPELMNVIGVSLVLNNNLPDALRFFLAALEGNEKNSGINTNIGLCYLKMDEPARGIPYFKRAVKTAPHDYQALLGYGIAQKLAGNPAAAIATLNEVIKLHPNAAEPYAWLGDAFLDLNRSAEALSSYIQSVKLDTDKVLPAGRYLNMSTLAHRNGDMPSAVQYLKDGLQRDPGSRAMRIQLAEFLYVDRKISEAIPVAKELIREKPLDGYGYFQLARCLFETAPLDAKKYFLQALKLGLGGAPAAEANSRLGLLAATSRDDSEALRRYERAYELAPDNIGVIETLIQQLLKASSPENMTKVAELAVRAIKLGATDRMQLCGVVHGASQQLKQPALAIQCWRDIQKYEPNNPDLHYNLGRALQDAEDWQGARVSYGRAVSLNPQSGVALYNLGYVEMKLGRTSSAAEWFSKAHAINSSLVPPKEMSQ